MCTAISFTSGDHYFGRNLDLEYCYQEAVTVIPRNFPFPYRRMKKDEKHLAMICMATVSKGYPLMYDATNEAGLSMAGLNFPGNAVYACPDSCKAGLAPYELIPWILGRFKSAKQAISVIKNMPILAIPFSSQYPLSDLHWILCDRESCYVLEPGKNGLRIYQDPARVLTNNPPFPYHLYNLCNYMGLSGKDPENKIAPGLSLTPYSRGMGAMGLPGDLSSASRFVRGVFTLKNSVRPTNEEGAVCQFFHILCAVEQQEGCVYVDGKPEKTVYASCCNTQKGIYYYTTYENRQPCAVCLHNEDLNGSTLISYPLEKKTSIRYLNRPSEK